MTRSRGMLIGLVVVLAFVSLELGLTLFKPPEAGVRIFNMGETPIVDLRIAYGGRTIAVETIPPQQSAFVHFAGWKRDLLTLNFTQLDNPLGSFQVADFDPAALRKENADLAIEIRENEFSRGHMPDETPTALGRLWRNVSSWFVDESEPSS